MIDLEAPDPFSLASWTANRLPTDDQTRWWTMCSVLSLIYGKPFLEVVVHLTDEAVAKA